MAGAKIVDRWILEYLCHRSWKEFTDRGSLSSKTIDFISGVLPNSFEHQETEVEKSIVYFIIVLCRLVDGEKVDVEYREGQVKTVLEDMKDFFDRLIQCQGGELEMEGHKMVEHINVEAVLVCCRAGNFDRASEVFQRVWGEVSNKEKTKVLLRNLIKSKKDNAEWLTTYTYDNFKGCMTEYLTLLYKSFGHPKLLMAAESLTSVAEDLEVDSSKLPNGKRKFSRDEVLAAVFPEDENNNSDKQSTSCKLRLRKLWNCQMREKFGGQSPQKQAEPKENSNTDTDNQTHELSPEEEPLEPKRKSSRLSEGLDPSGGLDQYEGFDQTQSDSDEETQCPHKSSPLKKPRQTSKVTEKTSPKKLSNSRQGSSNKSPTTGSSPHKSSNPESSPEIFIVLGDEPQKSSSGERSPHKPSDGEKTKKSTPLEKSPQKSTVRNDSHQKVTSSEKGPAKSPQAGTSRRENRSLTKDTPEKQADSDFRSPPPATLSSKLAYRKNQGRANRHEPVNHTKQDDETSSNSSFGMQSFVSVTSARKKWDFDEMMDFYNAVKEKGVGNWAEIRELLGTTRTNVMLKDKWRNMVKSGDLEKLTKIEKDSKKARKK